MDEKEHRARTKQDPIVLERIERMLATSSFAELREWLDALLLINTIVDGIGTWWADTRLICLRITTRMTELYDERGYEVVEANERE